MHIDRIKTLSIIALATNDELFQALVMKGGTALDTIYGISKRPSIDIDYSMTDDALNKETLELWSARLEKIFTSTFSRENLDILDFLLEKRPEEKGEGRPENWYGYRITFKALPHEVATGDLRKDRSISLQLGRAGKKEFQIDISPFEFTSGKRTHTVDDYDVYVYTPEMIALEKLRSLCQHTEEYRRQQSLGGTLKGRAKDFYDIVLLRNAGLFQLNDTTAPSLKFTLHGMFQAKNVDLSLLKALRKYHDLHERDFQSVRDSVGIREALQPFDYYFDEVLGMIDQLEVLGVV